MIVDFIMLLDIDLKWDIVMELKGVIVCSCQIFVNLPFALHSNVENPILIM